jgi:prepilin-type N-terminal cleavage/methylation domain-containing protein
LNKRAFTLIELLVVIAIIAILAAILFPVFAQAKESAKKTVALSNTKQLATALAIYQTDSEDMFPLAFSRRATGTWRWGTVHPVPTGTINSGGWNDPVINAQVANMWANSIQPYVKSYDMYLQPGQSAVPLTGDTYDPAIKPAEMGMTFNGLLHTFPASAIEQPSVVVTMWPGTGNVALRGRSGANPALRCASTQDLPCQFNPSGAPQAGLAAGANHSAFFGYGNFSGSYKVWAFQGGNVMARADTSAKFMKVGTNIAKADVDNWTDGFVEPYSKIDADASPVGSSWWYSTCSSGSEEAVDASQPRYVCFFRPDRTK